MSQPVIQSPCRAVVNDKGYAIVKVEFFDGTKSLGEAGNVDGGFQLVWNDVPEGGHSVTARASYDEDGKTVTSAPLTFTAAAAPLPRRKWLWIRSPV